MTEQRSGLRFDIYERVHLPEGLAGIQDLDEAELVPHIQVFEENDYAVIKGNLWLTGKYRGDGGEGEQYLEHLIPVEITMPITRVHQLQDVRVEIDQFDIELLSARSLNITGVLSLHGLEVMTSEQIWDEPKAAEEIFVHEPEKAANPPTVRTEPEGIEEDPLMQELEFDVPASNTAEKTAQPASDNSPPLQTPPLYFEIPVWEPAASSGKPSEAEPTAKDSSPDTTHRPEPGMPDREAAVSAAEDAARFRPEDGEARTEEREQSPADTAPEVPLRTEEREEPSPRGEETARVAAYVPTTRNANQEENVPIATDVEPEQTEEPAQKVEVAIVPKSESAEAMASLQSLVRPPAAALASRPEEAAPAASVAEAVEWKKLFIRTGEENTFKRLRICIVQKEETIEQIADRYRVNAREIALYNRLSSQQVGEGQILYIPS